MPIVVKKFTWWQTESKVLVKVEIPFVSQKNATVLTSSKLLKISHLPHIFEILLWDEINEDQSKCTFSNDHVLFELEKTSNRHWESLELQKPKDELKIIKNDILNEIAEQHRKKIEEKKALKAKRDRLSVQEQIDRDNDEHKRIQSIREEEKNKVLEELYSWKSNEVVHNQCNRSSVSIKEIFDDTESTKFMTKHDVKSAEKEHVVEVPKPRSFKTVEVNFTPRHFPTPSRESTQAEEQEWLKKQMDARRAAGFVEEDLRPEEHDPDWCLAKGDTFTTEHNYIGAISAYSHGIKLSPKMAVLYLNRSKAHIRVKNYHKAIEDATTALELMVPRVDGNLLWRAEAYFNRAIGLIELENAHLAVDELKAAMTLVPARCDIYGPELQRAINLASIHKEACDRANNSGNAPTIVYK
ncbi:dynein axonemal assembly factor 4-like [Adelges cooleyi]|uniref:dynein axonemal assembly factor 4-like n=1 Tax=Adelges cooleyi TaxID=133065 RepID=UPI0021805080|nr:dynein axonemal assembly factor 4-like [Adelges cooleyi]